MKARWVPMVWLLACSVPAQHLLADTGYCGPPQVQLEAAVMAGRRPRMPWVEGATMVGPNGQSCACSCPPHSH
eukprot:12413643-Karenia_brevis.AAC.1